MEILKHWWFDHLNKMLLQEDHY
uniref:Uncharacterized protein n=1 Tax=Arundo donax TaxID=35708 RepID=A0A0A9GVK2_ARUDO